MKKLSLFAVVLLCAVATFAQTNTSADEKAIRDIGAQWAKAAQEHNVDKAVSFYAENAALMPYGAPAANTPQQRRAVWQQLLSDTKTTINFGTSKLEVSKSGDLAYDAGWVEIKSTANGKTTVEKGKYAVVWKKINGQWKAVVDIFNTDK